MAKINIHPSLVRFTNQQHQLELPIASTETLVSSLCAHYPSLKTVILDADGELTPYVNIYINGKQINHFPPQHSVLAEDTVDVLTALVGG